MQSLYVSTTLRLYNSTSLQLYVSTTLRLYNSTSLRPSTVYLYYSFGDSATGGVKMEEVDSCGQC